MLGNLESWLVLLDETLPNVPYIDYGLYIKNYRPRFVSFARSGMHNNMTYALSSPLVYIETVATDPDPDWKTGGWMQQLSPQADWISSANNSFGIGSKYRLKLGQPKAFNLIDLGEATYNLQLTFPYWLLGLHVRVLAYIESGGVSGNPHVEMLKDLKTDVLRVEAKIDALSLSGVAPGSVSSGFNNSGTSSSLGIV